MDNRFRSGRVRTFVLNQGNRNNRR
ncbi:hypothetical protein CY0110_16637 [Crocosphaera chwakensis CCY0110]|uniref:Uncharacterized protein n=1 Tax=Crocosphaera chwakensis CCY0110 TaxID=391612 RepID=A3II09_9CHRO|nr:hypothetical protein CY0110_16637 [Crocosphaera chwakensis CCY0110]